MATRAPGSAEAEGLPESLEAERHAVLLTILRDANLRGEPGTGYSRVATAAPGERFTLAGRTEKGDWLRISRDKVKEAWVTAFLARVDGNLQQVPLAP